MKKKLLNSMITLVSAKFAGVYDKGGEPYFMHCMRVMQGVNTDDEELMCIALGHDLIEDTDVDFFYVEKNFGERVAKGIWALTKRKDLSYEDYQKQVLDNWDATRTKISDITDNSNIRRLKGVTQKDLDRLAKYHAFYQLLIEADRKFRTKPK